MIIIDGSHGEAGGQILRSAIALSSLIRKPVKVINIRKKRNPPGLKYQHLHAIKLLEKITRAKTENVYVGSEDITFMPTGIYGGYYGENIGTAGSIPLLLQAVALPALFADDNIRLRIIGGTDVKNSPSMDYFTHIIGFYLNKFANISINIVRRGFYPKGGGEVLLEISPRFKVNEYKNFDEFLEDISKIGKINLYVEDIKKIEIYSVSSYELKERNVAERMAEKAKELLEINGLPVKVRIDYAKTLSPGAVITLVAKTNTYVFGSDSIGEKGITAEKVAENAVSKLLRVIKNRVSIDEHLADNLIPYLMLVGGYFSTYELTGHLSTNIWVCKQFFNKEVKLNINKKVEIWI